MADGSFEMSFHFNTQAGTHRHSHIVTWVLSEETFGAPKVLPGQCWVSVKIIYEYFIQSLGPVNSIYDVRI